MPINKVAKFFSQNRLYIYKKGDIIMRSDEEDVRFIYFLERGYVKQSIVSEKGDEVILNIFKPGSFFPIMMAMNKIPNHYNFEVISSVSLRRANAEQVLEFVKRNTDVLYDLAKRLGRGILTLLSNMEYLSTTDARTRVLAGILLYARRYGIKTDNVIKIDIAFTHRDLANFLGLARETVTREIHNLATAKIVTKEKGKFIISLSKIERYIHKGKSISEVKCTGSGSVMNFLLLLLTQKQVVQEQRVF